MEGYIKRYKNWKFIFEDEETGPEDDETTVSTFMLRLLNNEVAKKSLINLLNVAISKLVKDTPVHVESIPMKFDSNVTINDVDPGGVDLGTTKIYLKPTSAKVTKITPTKIEGSEEISNKGNMSVRINLFMRVKNEQLIDRFTPPLSNGKGYKGITKSFGISASASYVVKEKEDIIKYKINSVTIDNITKILDKNVLRMLYIHPLQIILDNNTITLKDYKPNETESVYLDAMPINIMDNIPNKSGSIDIKNLEL